MSKRKHFDRDTLNRAEDSGHPKEYLRNQLALEETHRRFAEQEKREAATRRTYKRIDLIDYFREKEEKKKVEENDIENE